MKIKALLILLGVFAVFSACVQKSHKRVTEEMILSHVFLHQDTAILGYPILESEGVMFLSVPRSSPAYEFCCLKGDSLNKVGTFGNIGNGPYEFERPYFFLSADNKCLYIFTWNYRKLFRIPQPWEKNVYQPDKWEKIAFPESSNFFAVGNGNMCHLLNDSTLLAIGGEIVHHVTEDVDGENFLSLIHFGHSVEPVQGLSYPDSGRVDIPVNVKRMVYSEIALLRQFASDRFALVGKRGNYFILFDLKGNKAYNVNVVLDEYPRYTLAPDGINAQFSKEQGEGYRAQSTSRYIYLLESPFGTTDEWMHAEDYKGFPSGFRDKIQVYDWDGNYVKTYRLDIPVEAFMVTEDDSYIYGYTWDKESVEEKIAKFELPKL